MVAGCEYGWLGIGLGWVFLWAWFWLWLVGLMVVGWVARERGGGSGVVGQLVLEVGQFVG